MEQSYPVSGAGNARVKNIQKPMSKIHALHWMSLRFYTWLLCSFAQSCPTLATPWTAACQASLSFTISQSLLKLMAIESMMPFNQLPKGQAVC